MLQASGQTPEPRRTGEAQPQAQLALLSLAPRTLVVAQKKSDVCNLQKMASFLMGTTGLTPLKRDQAHRRCQKTKQSHLPKPLISSVQNAA